MSTTIKYLVRAKISEGRAAPHPSRLESALDVGIEGAPEDSGLDAIESFEVVDVTHAGTTTEAQTSALARLFELRDETPPILTADDWAEVRAEFLRYSIALRTIAQIQPRPQAVGVGFSHGFQPTLTAQPNDVRLDAMLTEMGVVWENPRA